jgi:hypothetical protein
VLVATAYAVVYAWPASIQPGRYVWGSHGDALGNAAEWTWATSSILNGQPLTVDHQLAWPFGDALGSLPHEPLFRWVTLGASLVIGPVATLNLVSLIAIPLTSWVAYRLALWVTGSWPAAFVAGIAYGCSAYVLQNTRGEPTLAQAWVFPLAALALLMMLKRPRPLYIAFAAIAIVVAATTDFYFALFAAAMAIVLVLAWHALTAIQRRRVATSSLLAAVGAGAAAIAVVGVLYVTTSGNLQASVSNIHRPASQLDVLAVSATDLVLPARYNPWFGGPRSDLYNRKLAQGGAAVDLTEALLPLPVLVLAPIGLLLFLWALWRWRRRPGGAIDIAAVGSLVAVALIGLWLLIPPDAVPRRSLSLEWDIYRLAPQFQAYHRAALLLALGAGVLAAVALARFLPARAVYSIPIVAVLSVAILAEDLIWPPDRALEVVSPPEYAWLGSHPGDYAIAEYPLFTNDAGGNEWTYDFNTRFYSHPTINGHISDTENASMRVELEDPNSSRVATALATLGVRYVIWHQDLADVVMGYDSSPSHTDAGSRPATSDYVRVAAFPDGATIYLVEAAPASAFGFFAAGFEGLSTFNGVPGRWLSGSTGRLDVYVPGGGGGTATVRFACQATSPIASLAVSESGQSLGTWQLSSGTPLSVSFDAPARPGINRLELRVTAALPSTPKGTAFCTLPEAS